MNKFRLGFWVFLLLLALNVGVSSAQTTVKTNQTKATQVETKSSQRMDTPAPKSLDVEKTKRLRFPNPVTETRAGYLKIGGIKGESAEQNSSPNPYKFVPAPMGYNCDSETDECECDSVLDCHNLFSSGDCQENSEWEDGNDPSQGGCIWDHD